jgi:hypothetical protein
LKISLSIDSIVKAKIESDEELVYLNVPKRPVKGKVIGSAYSFGLYPEKILIPGCTK